MANVTNVTMKEFGRQENQVNRQKERGERRKQKPENEKEKRGRGGGEVKGKEEEIRVRGTVRGWAKMGILVSILLSRAS